ncbi:hypothetical protein [Aurantiacibacter luteus]|uniref:DUF2157 domain-containing protein n=1 Tax=Aurantiacibacter luteus TaxID=1581420 RepID=A0A0G9MX35_9SPHN|nr:hypothetical protein [Aurantiacibacter luteus]KLE35114.1 hypothetical protein AAW00_01105 [Aurantiacibacter luteus]
MYSEQDLRDAVAGGAISAEAAEALRAHVAVLRHMPVIDEENFRLVNSFNDIFVTIGAVIMLVAMGAIGEALLPSVSGPSPLSAVLVAATAWMLAEVFTRARRMALPSIVLLLAFVGGTFATFLGLSITLVGDDPANSGETLAIVLVAASALLTAGAAWLHWRRFMVPITVAAGAAAVAATVIALIVAAIGPESEALENMILPLVFIAGLAVFAFAMRWDTSDRERRTRRSDVAFWLHLLAAPMIAHPVFALIGVMDNDAIGVGSAVAVLAVYVAFGLIALAVDRRALLVSALAYVLVALTFLFDRFGAVELTFALTALVIGSALLTLSAFWAPIRARVVEALPGTVQARVPAAGPVPLPA